MVETPFVLRSSWPVVEGGGGRELAEDSTLALYVADAIEVGCIEAAVESVINIENTSSIWV